MMLSFADNSRIDTAIAENDSKVPIIHRTTRAMGGMTTWAASALSGFTGFGTMCAAGRAIAVHSASGWFSGRAFSKAESFAQAASTATILGYGSSGTLRRRALATCGTRQTSASVTSASKA